MIIRMIRAGILAGGLSLSLVSAGMSDSPVRWQGSPAGWEPESAYCRLFDTKKVVTVTGMVQRVEKIIPMKGMGYGIYFMLKTNKETIPVHLGPTWYVENQSVHIKAQDTVEVTGSRVPCDGKEIILAASVKRGNDTVQFRDAKGLPAWAAWNRK